METPAAEVEVDAALVDALIHEQHPRLAGALQLVASGWDNAIYRLGDEHAVRLPRRALAVPLIENELRWLPEIATRMPVAVPAPIAAGRPSSIYPWPWSIVNWFDGTPADELDTAARDRIAAGLADALRALHTAAPVDAPHNAFRGVPLAQRDAVIRARLESGDLAQLLPLWDAGLDAPVHSGPALWLHGDLHPANAIVADGALAAIVDFGDMSAGDPACDLAAGWLFFGPMGRAAFRARLGAGYDGATWLRARAWAVALASALHAASAESARMSAVAAHAIRQLTQNEPAE